jgi:hypothetical protein
LRSLRHDRRQFGKIISNIADEISDSLSEARRHHSVQRPSDRTDRLDEDL